MKESTRESEKMEYKISLAEWRDIVETVSAFSNTKGGTIKVGVSDNGKVVGIDVGKNTIEKLANQIKQNTDHHIYPSIAVEEKNGRNIIVITVSESESRLVYAFGRPFKRVGRSNHRMGSEEIRKYNIQASKIYWDERICEEVSLKDIDEEKIRWFVRESRRQRGLDISEDASIDKVLMKLKLLIGKRLTNAAVLLFSRESKFLQSEVKCIRFSGNEPVKPYIDFQTLGGTVFDLIDGAEDFVLRNIKKAIWLESGKIQREEKFEYPPDAIREAIVNAVSHRDYESSSKIQIRIFDNRIEVWNPGLLPKGITLKDLKTAHISVPRNPLLFRQLFWVKYVEDVGGGTLDMIKWCKEWSLPEPDFKFISGATVVIFRLPPGIDDLEKLGLNERQKQAVDYVAKHGSITNREYQNINKTTRYTSSRDLAGLVKIGVFDRVGEGKRDLKYVLI